MKSIGTLMDKNKVLLAGEVYLLPQEIDWLAPYTNRQDVIKPTLNTKENKDAKTKRNI